MYPFVTQWSHKVHDILAMILAGLSFGATATAIDLWLKISLTAVTCVFMGYGVVMRHKRLKGYRPPDSKGDDAN